MISLSISPKKNHQKQKVVEAACAAVSAHPYRRIRIILTLINEIIMVVPPPRRLVNGPVCSCRGLRERRGGGRGDFWPDY